VFDLWVILPDFIPQISVTIRSVEAMNPAFPVKLSQSLMDDRWLHAGSGRTEGSIFTETLESRKIRSVPWARILWEEIQEQNRQIEQPSLR
jgi:hypothetical protein